MINDRVENEKAAFDIFNFTFGGAGLTYRFPQYEAHPSQTPGPPSPRGLSSFSQRPSSVGLTARTFVRTKVCTVKSYEVCWRRHCLQWRCPADMLSPSTRPPSARHGCAPPCAGLEDWTCVKYQLDTFQSKVFEYNVGSIKSYYTNAQLATFNNAIAIQFNQVWAHVPTSFPRSPAHNLCGMRRHMFAERFQTQIGGCRVDPCHVML